MSLRLAQWLEFLDVRATISHSEKDARTILDACASARASAGSTRATAASRERTSLRQILAENDELTVMRRRD